MEIIYTVASKGIHRFVIMHVFETVASQLIIQEDIQMCNSGTKNMCRLRLQLGVPLCVIIFKHL